MGVFIKRPFCMFCFCFISAALIACALPASLKLTLLAALLVGTLVFFAFCYKSRRKYGFIQTAIALIFAACAVFESLLFVDFKGKSLRELECENSAIDFVVLSEEYSSRYSSRYEGKIIAIDGKRVDESAYLVIDEEADYRAGDRIVLMGNVSYIESSGSGIFRFPADTSLEINSTIEKDLFIVEEYEKLDISVLGGKLRESVRGVFINRLDKNSAALSLGVLTGDTSMIERQTVRDFRRVGISHVLAVSGLHLAVILGAIEVLLIALRVKKGKRCVIVGALSFSMLLLAGFSPSVCRAVIMLLCAYLCYTLSREPDSLTSLSVAGMLILLISPTSVGSVSFWLSFLATLGIVLYSELLRYRSLRKQSKAKKISKNPLVKKIFGALVVTLSANVFICVISWLCFGEMSVISPISNLLITPLCELYLILSVIVLLLGGIPFVGGLISYAAGALSTLVRELAAYFSDFGFSVVSLRYRFAGIIICVSAVLLAVLFIVKLRKRFIIALLPVLSALAFCICLGVYNFTNSSVKAAYINREANDSLVLAEGGKCVIIDASNGGYSSFYSAYEWTRGSAFTEIESVVLTHYHERHISSLDRLFGEAMVRDVCLPAPTSRDELEIMKSIISLALDSGVEVKLYGDEEIFEICDGFSIFKLPDGLRKGSSRKIISFSVATRDGILAYADSSWHNSDVKGRVAHFISSSDLLVLGLHGPEAITEKDTVKVEYPCVAVGADIEIFARTPHLSEARPELLIAKDGAGVKICEFEFPQE